MIGARNSFQRFHNGTRKSASHNLRRLKPGLHLESRRHGCKPCPSKTLAGTARIDLLAGYWQGSPPFAMTTFVVLPLAGAFGFVGAKATTG